MKILEGAAGEKEREGGGEGGGATGGCGCMGKARGGGRGARQSRAERECRLFPCVGRTGEPSWLQAGAVSP